MAWQVVAVYESSRKVEAMPARRVLDKLLGAPRQPCSPGACVRVVPVLDLIASLPLTTSRRVQRLRPWLRRMRRLVLPMHIRNIYEVETRARHCRLRADGAGPLWQTIYLVGHFGSYLVCPHPNPIDSVANPETRDLKLQLSKHLIPKPLPTLPYALIGVSNRLYPVEPDAYIV